MFGDIGFAGAAGVGARRMEEGAARASSAIDDFFGEDLKIFRIVVGLVAHHFDQSAPSVAEADHLVTFAKRAESDAADGGVESGNVAAAGENSDDALLGVDVCHVSLCVRTVLFAIEQTILHEWR